MLYTSNIASLLILGSNVVLGLAGLYAAPELIRRCLFRPYEFARGRNRSTLLTSGFMHADLPHLIFNMVSFWFFGLALERYIGTPRFVLLYVLGLVLSLWPTYRKHRNDPNYATLGASGAISAVVFAAIVYFPSMKLMILPIPVPIPAPIYAVGYLAYSWWASKQRVGNINHDAHLAGALVGVAFVALLDFGALMRALQFIIG